MGEDRPRAPLSSTAGSTTRSSSRRARPIGLDRAMVAVTGSSWLLVAGLAGHGPEDLWHQHTGFVASTRWWPPSCVVAALIAVGDRGRRPHRMVRSSPGPEGDLRP